MKVVSMNNMLQNMYQRHEDANAKDPEIVVLLVKARNVFSVVRNVDWLEWGSELMPEMRKTLAEEECQAKIECRAHDNVERCT